MESVSDPGKVSHLKCSEQSGTRLIEGIFLFSGGGYFSVHMQPIISPWDIVALI